MWVGDKEKGGVTVRVRGGVGRQQQGGGSGGGWKFAVAFACVLFFFDEPATTKIYTETVVGGVRGV